MLATPSFRLNILCTCTECNTFLRPYPTNKNPISPLSGLDYDLTTITTPKLGTQLAPSLAPSPSFTFTKFSPSKLKMNAQPMPSPIKISQKGSIKATLASRSLWTNISSPIDEPITSAKTPGLTVCAKDKCTGKVIPDFGRGLCRTCEGELRSSIDSMLATKVEELDTDKKTIWNAKPSRSDSLLSPTIETATAEGNQHIKNKDTQETDLALFALPSTKLSITHALNFTPQRDMKREEELETGLNLFTLPATKPEQDFIRYSMNFSTAPDSTLTTSKSPKLTQPKQQTTHSLCSAQQSTQQESYKLTHSSLYSTQTIPLTLPPSSPLALPTTNTTAAAALSATVPTQPILFSPSRVEFFGKVDFRQKVDWGADWDGTLRSRRGWAVCLRITKVLRGGV
jgi:hypothetical protein